MKKCANKLEIDIENIILMGKDRQYYFIDTPLSVGLEEENLNEIDVYKKSDANSNIINIKWLLKEKKPIIFDVFEVNYIIYI